MASLLHVYFPLCSRKLESKLLLRTDTTLQLCQFHPALLANDTADAPFGLGYLSGVIVG